MHTELPSCWQNSNLFKCLQGNPNLNDKLLPADWLEDLLQIRQATL